MTVTTTPRRTREQILAEARDLVGAGSIPSRESLRKSLGVRYDTATEVHATLSRERAERRTERARKARADLARLARRKRPSPRPAVILPPLPEAPAEAVAELPAPVIDSTSANAREEVAEARPVPVETSSRPAQPVRTWPILVIAAGAFVAVWAGWVGLGGLTGFGLVNLLPGLVEDGGWATIDTRITLPASMEAYSAYAFYVLLHRNVPRRARIFAAWSAGLAVALGMGAQVAYHQMIAAGVTVAPAWVISVVSCIPVATFALGCALRAMVRSES